MNELMKVLCLLAFVLVFAAFAVNDSTRAAPQGEEIIQDVCTRCHTTERICAHLGKDAAFWTNTAMRMRMNGAPLPTGQVPVVADYLGGLKPDTERSEPICQ